MDRTHGTGRALTISPPSDGADLVGSRVTTVVIGVPTFRRPADLQVLIPMLLGQAESLDAHAVEVVVVDNDPAESARDVCRRFRGAALRYVGEPTPGIAAVRNRILAEAGDADVVVMIDDDELPEPGWLAALLQTWCTTRAALVAGRVVASFAGELDPWLAAGRFFTRRNLATGTPISVAAAGNLLLDLGQVRALGLGFDEGLGLAGGEDTLFTKQLHARGGRMVWCAESVILDQVPAARMTRRWVLARARSHGHATVRSDLRGASTPTARARVRLRAVAGGLTRVGAGALRAGGGVVLSDQRHQARGLRTTMRGLGMLKAASGITHDEYARPAAAPRVRP